ncbi:DUF1549 and DUF1553 domain-containing protein [Limnoglobus roseus]|uniref:DUF1549 domain-containing protein n=1 Tax=Limnoglobus roseus TaxID=2598579 RepID=A0A5C1AQX2_9BACT|nr:DUF1549 and DUF1553 domain-containing protein [Limnoglobus roseus]QEL19594.1 hypothetical protein PX52LOC_06670 [Limnoglobus roseus]
MRFQIILLLVGFGSSAVRAADAPDPAKLAARIDAALRAGWDQAKVRPTVVADDATFLRRATLDLVGRIPSIAETRAFLADKSESKRAKLVTRLIDSGGHTRHMATYWRRAWVPQADTVEFARLADDFETWLAARLQENAGYDLIVRELLTTPVAKEKRAAAVRGGAVTPIVFFSANEGKAENLAASSTRAFLGVNLDCAQCHDHPFAKWTRDQFWQTAAFFAAPQMEGGKVSLQLTIPNTKKTLSAELMDGSPVKWPENVTPEAGRAAFAKWATGPGNPYFARNAVNRAWAQAFGTALVEPLDDLSGESGTAGPHADLLRDIATAFEANGFDLKYLSRAMALTTTYQLSATVQDATPSDPRLFARMPVRGLTGEQLYDSLRTAAGLAHDRDDAGRKRFAAQFHVERAVTAVRSITQSLATMNGRVTADLTDPAKNATLRGLLDAPFLDTPGKVEALFLAVLGRRPTADEIAPLARYVEAGGTDNDTSKAFGDLFWALVNTTEFNTNH